MYRGGGGCSQCSRPLVVLHSVEWMSGVYRGVYGYIAVQAGGSQCSRSLIVLHSVEWGGGVYRGV